MQKGEVRFELHPMLKSDWHWTVMGAPQDRMCFPTLLRTHQNGSATYTSGVSDLVIGD